MHISRLELAGKFTVSAQFPLPSEDAPTAPFVVIGPNGSGKSLLVLGLIAAMSHDTAAAQAARILVSAGVERVRIEVLYKGWMGRLICLLPGRESQVSWDRPPEEAHIAPVPMKSLEELWSCSEPPVLADAGLFPLLHVVHSGHLELPKAFDLVAELRAAVKSPLERELEGWKTRLAELAGDDGHGGKYGRCFAEVQAAEAELETVEEKRRALDNALMRKADLLSKIAEARLKCNVLSLESDELAKASRLADRAVRIENWCEEIRQESREVLRLREQHISLQAQLDGLEERFRGAPDDFPARLEEYQLLRAQEQTVASELALLEQERQRAEAELDALRRELSQIPRFPEASLDARRQSLENEIETVNNELTTCLRGRIELIRQREGLRQQIAQEYALFAGLDESMRPALEDFLKAEPAPGADAAETSEVPAEMRQTQEKLDIVRGRLAEKFSTFERVPLTAAEMLKTLADQRHVLSTLSSDIAAMQQKVKALHHENRPVRGWIWSAAAALVAFGIVTGLHQWDTGLFAALVASGVMLLIFRRIHQRIETAIDASMAAEVMTQKRAEDVRIDIARLERELGALSMFGDVYEALARLAEYRGLCEERDQLERRLAEQRQALEYARSQEAQAPVESELPAAITTQPLDILRRDYEQFLELESRLSAANASWQDYIEGGSRAAHIRSLEEKVQELRRQLSESDENRKRRIEQTEEHRAGVSARISILERLLESNEKQDRLHSELGTARIRLTALRAELGPFAAEDDVDGLRRDWNERETLRTRLRETRNALSGHQTHDELRARESLLTEEASQVRQKLTAHDPLYLLQGNAVDHASKYAGQLRVTRDNIDEQEATIHLLQTELDGLDIARLEAEVHGQSDSADLRVKLTQARDKLDTVERDLMTTRELITSIESEIAESDPATVSYLGEAVDNRVRQLSAERFLSLDMSGEVWTVACADGVTRSLDALSEGMRELVWIAVRLAALDVAQACETAALVWDEALSRLDDSHLARVREILFRMAAHRQIILLTRHSSFESWGTVIRLRQETERPTEPAAV